MINSFEDEQSGRKTGFPNQHYDYLDEYIYGSARVAERFRLVQRRAVPRRDDLIMRWLYSTGRLRREDCADPEALHRLLD